jgi:hypothetical protein
LNIPLGVSDIRRLLFVSFACYLDDANGAAVASRAMMEALARRGLAGEVLCGPLFELNGETDLTSVRLQPEVVVSDGGGSLTREILSGTVDSDFTGR